MNPELLFTINGCSSIFMCGVIWFVQLVHYPSFITQQPQNFISSHRDHVFRTGLVVIPAMLTELGTSLLLVLNTAYLPELNLAGLLLVLAIWISTFFIQARIHRKLQAGGYNELLILWLINTNWLRTILWTIKTILFAYGFLFLVLH